MASFKRSRRGSNSVTIATQQFQITEPRCKVCTHPQRREIDMMLALGWSQVDVRNHWNRIMELQGIPKEEWFTRSGLSHHATRHLSAKDAAVRKIVEARARAEGIDVEAIEGFILTKQAAAETVVLQGLDSVLRGHTTVEPRDILTAIKVLIDLEKDRSAVAEETMLQEIRSFTTAVKKVVPEEMWEEIYDQFEKEVEKFNPAIMPAPISDAQVDSDTQFEIVEAEEKEEQLQLDIDEKWEQLQLFDLEDYNGSS